MGTPTPREASRRMRSTREVADPGSRRISASVRSAGSSFSAPVFSPGRLEPRGRLEASRGRAPTRRSASARLGAADDLAGPRIAAPVTPALESAFFLPARRRRPCPWKPTAVSSRPLRADERDAHDQRGQVLAGLHDAPGADACIVTSRGNMVHRRAAPAAAARPASHAVAVVAVRRTGWPAQLRRRARAPGLQTFRATVFVTSGFRRYRFANARNSRRRREDARLCSSTYAEAAARTPSTRASRRRVLDDDDVFFPPRALGPAPPAALWSKHVAGVDALECAPAPRRRADVATTGGVPHARLARLVSPWRFLPGRSEAFTPKSAVARRGVGAGGARRRRPNVARSRIRRIEPRCARARARARVVDRPARGREHTAARTLLTVGHAQVRRATSSAATPRASASRVVLRRFASRVEPRRQLAATSSGALTVRLERIRAFVSTASRVTSGGIARPGRGGRSGWTRAGSFIGSRRRVVRARAARAARARPRRARGGGLTRRRRRTPTPSGDAGRAQLDAAAAARTVQGDANGDEGVARGSSARARHCSAPRPRRTRRRRRQGGRAARWRRAPRRRRGAARGGSDDAARYAVAR